MNTLQYFMIKKTCQTTNTLPFMLFLIMLMFTISASGQPNKSKKQSGQKQQTELSGIKPEDGTGAYATGIYRNLFAEKGHPQKKITAKLNAAFNQLFHGDSSQVIFFDTGKNGNGPLACIEDVNHHDVRSEGMSYGMMIAVQMDKKAEFDALWNWAMTYMYISDPKHPSEGYFSWSLKRDGIPNAETPAPDGEEYIVMALYFASGRWGNGTGIYDYKSWADKILTTIRHHPGKTGPTRFGPRTVYSMINEDHKMIRFVPDYTRFDFTDPSYHLPAFYELWARWGPEADREFWAAAADSSRRFFMKATHPSTALCCDYSNFDGSPVRSPWNRTSSLFSYDSWRTASNWSVDWSWWKKDPGEQELSNRLQSFFASQGIKTYGCQFEQEGTCRNTNHTTGLVSTNAVASLASTLPVAGDFVEELWKAPVPSRFGERYYDGLLYLMSLLHCSGRYRIWVPKI